MFSSHSTCSRKEIKHDLIDCVALRVIEDPGLLNDREEVVQANSDATGRVQVIAVLRAYCMTASMDSINYFRRVAKEQDFGLKPRVFGPILLIVNVLLNLTSVVMNLINGLLGPQVEV
ncbi:hypothetical protein DGG96_08385 [Legionella qingyii]|uniref:Uncharacterized protein n=1 Tax=Legionella qingyii TaxID=2184757 RepID=A0A317U6Z4_9GAMM|nr:hypothetical protein DGG96_08385 [Legionella qingyii]